MSAVVKCAFFSKCYWGGARPEVQIHVFLSTALETSAARLTSPHSTRKIFKPFGDCYVDDAFDSRRQPVPAMQKRSLYSHKEKSFHETSLAQNMSQLHSITNGHTQMENICVTRGPDQKGHRMFFKPAGALGLSARRQTVGPSAPCNAASLRTGRCVRRGTRCNGTQ
jgi:hypothetical protein